MTDNTRIAYVSVPKSWHSATAAIVALITIALPGCRRKTPPPPADTNTPTATTAPVPQVLATVNDQNITEADVKTLVQEKMAQITTTTPKLSNMGREQREREFTKEVTDTLIAKALLNAQVQQQNITVSDEEIAQRLIAYPAPADTSPEEYRTRVREDLAWRKLFAKQYTGKIDVTDAEIKTYYDTHQDEFATPKQIRASHIQLDGGDRSLAESLLSQLKNGADFATLAKARTTDKTSAAQGGDLGYFQSGDLEPPFEKAAFALQPGQLSNIVETSYGLHIIKVTDRKAATKQTLDQARDKIKTKLIERKKAEVRKSYVASLRKNANLN